MLRGVYATVMLSTTVLTIYYSTYLSTPTSRCRCSNLLMDAGEEALLVAEKYIVVEWIEHFIKICV